MKYYLRLPVYVSKEPKWKAGPNQEDTVGVASWWFKKHNAIYVEFAYYDTDGIPTYPHMYYLTKRMWLKGLPEKMGKYKGKAVAVADMPIALRNIRVPK